MISPLLPTSNRRAWHAFANDVIQQMTIFYGELPILQEVRPFLIRRAQRLLAAPEPDRLMVPGEEDLRHCHAPNLRRPGVMWIFQQSIRERFLNDRIGITQDARH